MSTSLPAHAAGALRAFYFLRAAVAFVWVAIAFTVPPLPALAALLLAVYAGWDALANVIDARRAGGLAQNRLQTINMWFSLAAALGMATGIVAGLQWSVAVFGAWALGAGLLQLGVGIRRRRHQIAGQWLMILSGAQSALAGAFFIQMAVTKPATGLSDLAPYAAFGASYFLLSALWLTWTLQRSGALRS